MIFNRRAGKTGPREGVDVTKKLDLYGSIVLAIWLLLASVPVAWGTAMSHAGSGQHGTISHPGQGYLGVSVRDVAEEQVSVLRLKDTRGAVIVRVDHDGPAGKMGLREHDVVLHMNGTVIEGEEQMRRLLHEYAPGRAVVMVISRDGQAMTMTSVMADRSELERQTWEQHLAPGPQAPAAALPSGEEATADSSPVVGAAPSSRYSKSFLGTLLMSPSYTGAMLEVMGPQLGQFFGVQGGTGLLVRSVVTNSPAEKAGLHAGDVVVRANARDVHTTNEWAKTIKEAKGRPVAVVVLRDKQEKTLTLTPDGKRRSALGLPIEFQYDAVDPVRLACLTDL